MSTLQALCEAAEMSYQLPVNEKHSSDNRDYLNSSHVETASSLVALSSKATLFTGKMGPSRSHPDGISYYRSSSFQKDERDSQDSIYNNKRYMNEEGREASSPIMHLPSTSSTDPPHPIPPNSSSSKTTVPKKRKRGWVKKTWEERLGELKAYKAEHGDCNVPTLSKLNPSLGHWVHDQRKQYRLHESGKPTSMTNIRVAKLEEIGFKWALQKHTCMKSWAERYAELMKYKEHFQNTNVPIRWKKNPSLGQWVSTQRQEYGNFKSGKKSNMTQARIDALNSIGFVWCLRDTTKMAPRKSWGMHFKALERFKEQYGHCDVRVRSKLNPTGALGRWVEKQRSQYPLFVEGKPCKITVEQVRKLESIGFKWRIRSDNKKA